MPSIRISKTINLPLINAEIISAAEEGVEAACQEGVSFIKNNVILGEEFVGNKNYPDVKPATKKQKAKRGETHVLIHTGVYKDSWIADVKGLEGTIKSGSEGYFAKIHENWRIDRLFKDVHGDETLEIIERAIKKKL